MPNMKKEALPVIAALKALEDIPMPDSDNEGLPINSPEVYPQLTPEQQERVDDAERLARDFLVRLTDTGETINKTAQRHLEAHDVGVTLSQNPNDLELIQGHVRVGDVKLDLSDTPPDDLAR